MTESTEKIEATETKSTTEVPANPVEDVTWMDCFKLFFGEVLPNLLVDLFQIYLIIDKLFEINFLGYEMSWFQVFTPFWMSFIVVAIFRFFDKGKS